MTKIVCISDTHMATPDLPKGDILVHAGDFTFRGGPHEIGQQLNWLGKHVKNYAAVIAIPGNHDFGFESDYYKYKQEAALKGITFLNDSELVVNGLKFWGSPITPWFHNWAFNRHPEDIEVHWDFIPNDVNVLITHGPPHMIMDQVPDYDRVQIGYDQHYRPIFSKKLISVRNVGCPELLERIKTKTQLRLHVFGHIHEGYGQEEHNGVKFVNASIMDADYKPVNKPIVIDL